MSPEETIFVMKWQVAAALLMGLDYFIPDNWRQNANDYVKNYFKGMQHRIDKDVTDAFHDFKRKLPRLIIALAQVLAGIAILFAANFIGKQHFLVFMLVLCLAIFLIVAGFNFAFENVFSFLQTLGLAAPFRLFTTFLVGSPKGPIAAFGFLCLFISFYLRYSYVKI